MTRLTEELVGRQPAHYDANAAASAGALAGVIAGLVFAGIRVGLDVAGGASPWRLLRGWSAPFLGSRAVGDGLLVVPILAGAAAHLALSLFFGLAFGIACFSLQRPTVLWCGLLDGALVYGLMTFIVLPVAAPWLVVGELSLTGVASHLAFGVTLGVSFERLRFRAVEPAGTRHLGRTLIIAPHPR